jgi:hypothetical protein
MELAREPAGRQVAEQRWLTRERRSGVDDRQGSGLGADSEPVGIGSHDPGAVAHEHEPDGRLPDPDCGQQGVPGVGSQPARGEGEQSVACARRHPHGAAVGRGITRTGLQPASTLDTTECAGSVSAFATSITDSEPTALGSFTPSLVE